MTDKVLCNPMIGHQITILQTAEQTNGQPLQIEYSVTQPESKPAFPLHKHLKCEEYSW